MELLPLKPISFNFIFRRSLLTDKTSSQSFLHKNLTMTLSLFVRQFHAWISWERISQPTLLKTSSTFDSKFSFETSQEMPATSKHSALEYCAFTQHCRSISITLLLRSVLIFLSILISDSSLTKFSLNLRTSLMILDTNDVLWCTFYLFRVLISPVYLDWHHVRWKWDSSSTLNKSKIIGKVNVR